MQTRTRQNSKASNIKVSKLGKERGKGTTDGAENGNKIKREMIGETIDK